MWWGNAQHVPLKARDVFRMTGSILSGFVAILLATHNTVPGPGIWDILEQTDPITDTRIITATLSSTTQPTIPLTIRCRIESEGTTRLDLFMVWKGRHTDLGKELRIDGLPPVALIKARLGKQKANEDWVWIAEPFNLKGRQMTGTFYDPNFAGMSTRRDPVRLFILAMGRHSVFAAQFNGENGSQVAVWDTEDMLTAIAPVLSKCP